MKILFITDTYLRKSHVGGGDIIAQKLQHGLESLGHKVIVACCSGEDYEQVDEAGVYRIFSPNYLLRKLKPIDIFLSLLNERNRLRSLINKFDPDVILCLQHGRVATPTISFLNSLKIPKVFEISGMSVRFSNPSHENCAWVKFWNNTKNPLFRLLIPVLSMFSNDMIHFYKFTKIKPDLIIVNSSDLKARISEILNPNIKIFLITHGIDLSIFKRVKHILRSPLKLLHVGRLKKDKGIDILIETMSYIRNHKPDCKITLTIVGWSNVKRDVDYFRKLIEDEHLEDLVTLQGVVPNSKLPKMFGSHDIFVFPSSNRRIEGCPAVILEALACGLPIVANLGPGTNEILKGEVTCVEVKNDKPKDLAEGILKLAGSNDLYKSLQENGCRMIKKNHSLENYVASFENVLKEAVSSKFI